jgi:hypothetical protein
MSSLDNAYPLAYPQDPDTFCQGTNPGPFFAQPPSP